MTKSLKKLNLNRETLLPLGADELDGVHGGITPSVVVPIAAATITVASAIGCTWLQRKLGLDK